MWSALKGIAVKQLFYQGCHIVVSSIVIFICSLSLSYLSHSQALSLSLTYTHIAKMNYCWAQSDGV